MAINLNNFILDNEVPVRQPLVANLPHLSQYVSTMNQYGLHREQKLDNISQQISILSDKINSDDAPEAYEIIQNYKDILNNIYSDGNAIDWFNRASQIGRALAEDKKLHAMIKSNNDYQAWVKSLDSMQLDAETKEATKIYNKYKINYQYNDNNEVVGAETWKPQYEVMQDIDINAYIKEALSNIQPSSTTTGGNVTGYTTNEGKGYQKVSSTKTRLYVSLNDANAVMKGRIEKDQRFQKYIEQLYWRNETLANDRKSKIDNIDKELYLMDKTNPRYESLIRQKEQLQKEYNRYNAYITNENGIIDKNYTNRFLKSYEDEIKKYTYSRTSNTGAQNVTSNTVRDTVTNGGISSSVIEEIYSILSGGQDGPSVYNK